jgi:hypothetical protein
VEEPKILFDQTKKCIAYTQKQKRTYTKKNLPIILECYSSRKKNIFSIFEPSMLLWKSLHFTKKKNPKTLMSIYSRVKRFSEKKKSTAFYVVLAPI